MPFAHDAFSVGAAVEAAVAVLALVAQYGHVAAIDALPRVEGKLHVDPATLRATSFRAVVLHDVEPVIDTELGCIFLSHEALPGSQNVAFASLRAILNFFFSHA